MSVSRIFSVTATATAALLITPSAYSHVTLETPQAHVSNSYKAVFKVSHGCQGSPTVKIRVRVPEGVISVKPQPKAGWTLQTVKGDYSGSYTRHSARVSSGVKEVIWSGGPLADEHYDEFVFTSFLTDALKPDTTLYFPVVQECEQGVARWIDLPEEDHGHGQSHDHSHGHSHSHEHQAAHDHSNSPAPGVKLLPSK